jgi:hypothetical protein
MSQSIGGTAGLARSRVRTARRDGTAGLSLTRWRRWFAEGDENGNAGAADDQGSGSADPLEVWLKKLPAELQADGERFHAELRNNRRDAAERRKKAEELEQSIAKAEADRKAAEAKRLAEQGDWQKLAEQRAADLEKLQPIQQMAEALQNRIKAGNEARIAKLPEPMRKLVPANYGVVELSEWLDANYDTLVKPTAPDLDAGKKGGKGDKLPPKDDVLGKRKFTRY